MGFDPISLAISAVSVAGSFFASPAGAAVVGGAIAGIGKGIIAEENRAFQQGLTEEERAKAAQFGGTAQEFIRGGGEEARAAFAPATAGTKFDPYVGAGTEALEQYRQAVTPGGQEAFRETPLFKFQEESLQKNLAQQLASAGLGGSGVGVKEIAAPAFQSLAAQESERFLSRLQPLISTGYGAAGQAQNIEETRRINEAKLAIEQSKRLADIEAQTGATTVQREEAKKLEEAKVKLLSPPKTPLKNVDPYLQFRY